MSQPSEADITEALAYKEQGNEYFKEKNYQEAIKMYTMAIEKNPTCSIYFSNRSRCYFNVKDYDKSLEDAQYAVKLDDKNIKAYYLTGESLVQIAMNTKDKRKMEIAIQKLKKSLVLCPSQGKQQFEQNFIDKIYLCKKNLWKLTFEQQKQKKKKVRSYLIHLVQSDKNLTEEDKDSLNQKILKLLETMNSQDISKIPSSLVCPITKMILKDPVCNEYGHTYSRKQYLEYLKENAMKDPITGNVVKYHLMYPNINVKKAVEMVLQKNPWAYDQKIVS